MRLPNDLLRVLKVVVLAEEADQDLITGISHRRFMYSCEIFEQNTELRYDF